MVQGQLIELRRRVREVTKMFSWYAPAWLARLAHFAEGRPSHELESPREFPAAADFSARLERILEQLPGERRVVVELAYRYKCQNRQIADFKDYRPFVVFRYDMKSSTSSSIRFSRPF
jgi:DNA-directed RNA polymerase specialized sigma24 family protein